MSIFLVTGVAGFIGSRVAAQLLASGHTVVGVDSFNDSCDAALKKHRINSISAPSATQNENNFHFELFEIGATSRLGEVFAKYGDFAAVIHLAARAGVRDSFLTPCKYVHSNILATTHLLETMRARKVHKFIFASTSSLYAGLKPPFSEDLPVNIPLSPYAVTKKSAEMLADIYHKHHGFDVAILRYFTVFGPAGRPDMSVFRFIQALETGEPVSIYGDGSQTRDWTYVDDIVHGTIAAATRPLGNEIINLGGGCRPPVSLNEILAFLEDETGKKLVRNELPFHSADMETTSADISKAARLLDWKPQISWREGLRRTVAWHRENGTWLRTLRH